MTKVCISYAADARLVASICFHIIIILFVIELVDSEFSRKIV